MFKGKVFMFNVNKFGFFFMSMNFVGNVIFQFFVLFCQNNLYNKCNWIVDIGVLDNMSFYLDLFFKIKFFK